jgi:23S rRNA G2445 N2-methylase RlmL
MSSIDLIAATAFGLEAVTIRELQALGYEGKGSQPGWVAFRGDLSAICRANLWLRSADRVLIRMGEFPAEDFGQLFDRTSAALGAVAAADANFPVNGRSIRSQLSSVPACQKIVKKAIVSAAGAYRQGSGLGETRTWSRLSETGPATRSTWRSGTTWPRCPSTRRPLVSTSGGTGRWSARRR